MPRRGGSCHRRKTPRSGQQRNSDGQTSSKNLRRVRDQTLSYPCLGRHSLERSRNVLGDPIFWIFVLPGLLLGAYAQSRIKIKAKYSQVGTQDGITGAQVARRLLDS